MPFMLDEFARKRPYLFHLTDRSHLEPLRAQRKLKPASALFKEAGQRAWDRQKRQQHIEIVVDERRLRVRDQSPLHEGNMKLSDGWTFSEFIAHLNQRVFFWPGRSDGLPIAYGKRHYERYVEESPIILRLRTEQVFTANAGLNPEFCRFNSGSPRWTYGKPSPRGAGTFVQCTAANFLISQVVEVTFPNPVILPRDAEVADSPTGPWRRF